MKMLLISTVFLLSYVLTSAQTSGQKSRSIWGYHPENDLRDYLELDMDKASIEVELRIAGVSNFKSAEELYRRGGFSASYALLELQEITGLASSIKRGAKVYGKSQQGKEINGEVMHDLDIGEIFIPVSYRYPPYNRNTNFTCVVGSLPTIGIEVTSGCFVPEGSIAFEFASGRDSYDYRYNVIEDNRNDLTMQMLSINAQEEMLVCRGCPHAMFKKYFDYYKVPDYGDRWITSVFSGSKTQLYRGNADFSTYSSQKKAQGEAIKLGIDVLNLWMYFIHKLNVGVEACSHGKIDIYSWEQALALYTGSMDYSEKKIQASREKGKGKMLHAMADNFCPQFKTCTGEDGSSGPSIVSTKIFNYFEEGIGFLKRKQCDAAAEKKKLMEKIMIIPLLQGLQIHSYQRTRNPSGNKDPSERAEEEAKGATYSAAVLPLLHECSPKDAQELYDLLKVGASSEFDTKSFDNVKAILEKHYSCMGVACNDVGNLYNPLTNKFREVPKCRKPSRVTEGERIGGIVLGLTMLTTLVCCAICNRDRREGGGDFVNMCYQCWCGRRRTVKKQRQQDEIPLTPIKNNYVV